MLTQYDKFTEEIEIYVYKKIAKVKFYSIKTLICTTRWKVCSNKTIREETEVFYFVSLENDTDNIFKPVYSDSDVYRCYLCNAQAGNPNPPLISGAIRKTEIKAISSYVLVQLGRVKLNGIDKVKFSVTIPESNTILGKILILEA